MINKALQQAFTHTLLKWNAEINDRKMPWKGEKNPYKIWLSEIILQQTRVEQGWEYYKRFVKQYPTIQKLAAAKEEEVFKLWEGLGYYSRCKNLIATAQFIASDLKGQFPEDYEEILKLKGVGPYTAAAIASFAYNAPYAVVDGNVSRVLARFFGSETPIDNNNGKVFFAGLAQELLDKQNAALYNQAIMDFGATVCKPQLPLCSACLLQKKCSAFASGKINMLPVKEKKIIKVQRWFYFIIAEYKGAFYISKRTGKDIWQNLHQFILIETTQKIEVSELTNTEEFKNLLLPKYSLVNVSPFYKQQLTHQTIHGCFIHIKLDKKISIPAFKLLDKKSAAKLAFPKFINSYLQLSETLMP
ncbi:MAG: A/G-specific adenine glycosylase [Ferruginibacter sp.]